VKARFDSNADTAQGRGFSREFPRETAFNIDWGGRKRFLTTFDHE